MSDCLCLRFFTLFQNVIAFQTHDHSFRFFLCHFKKLYQIIMLKLIPASLTAVHFVPPFRLSSLPGTCSAPAPTGIFFLASLFCSFSSLFFFCASSRWCFLYEYPSLANIGSFRLCLTRSIECRRLFWKKMTQHKRCRVLFSPRLQLDYVRSLLALGALFDVELDLLAFS